MLFNVLICTIGYFGLDRYLENNNISLKNINLFISNIHACASFIISSGYLLNYIDMSTYVNLNLISLGYAIYDIFLMIKLQMPQLHFLILHHLMIIVTNTYVNMYEDLFVVKMMAFNYLTEFTTPMLNLSLYLYQNNKTNMTIKNVNIFKVSNILLIFSFFIFRILLGFYLVKVTLFYNFLSYFQIIMLGMNIHWFIKLLNKVNKNIDKKN